MAKKRQMRWTDEGAHYLAQVGLAVLNGEIWVKELVASSRKQAANPLRVRHAA